MTLLISLGVLSVYREADGVRFTVPVKDSSVVLTPEQTHELTTVLVKLFPKRKRGNPA